MPTLITETKVNNVPEICFDLIRQASSKIGRQKVIGDFGKGQIVVFQNSFLGIKQNLTVKVTDFDRPHIFVDEMTKGNFKYFRHTHEFILQNDDQTKLRDVFEWTAPLGIFGKLFNKIIENRLRKIVTHRNQTLIEIAEQ